MARSLIFNHYQGYAHLIHAWLAFEPTWLVGCSVVSWPDGGVVGWLVGLLAVLLICWLAWLAVFTSWLAQVVGWLLCWLVGDGS